MNKETKRKLYRKAGLDPAMLDEEEDRAREEEKKRLAQRQQEIRKVASGR